MCSSEGCIPYKQFKPMTENELTIKELQDIAGGGTSTGNAFVGNPNALGKSVERFNKITTLRLSADSNIFPASKQLSGNNVTFPIHRGTNLDILG